MHNYLWVYDEYVDISKKVRGVRVTTEMGNKPSADDEEWVVVVVVGKRKGSWRRINPARSIKAVAREVCDEDYNNTIHNIVTTLYIYV